MRFLRPLPLDRYVFAEFWKTFVAMALGFPILVVIIDLTDNLDKYLARDLPRANIALSYLYGLPDSMFLVLPAAVLFATVFTISTFTRHSEITAAKASGVSFYRFIAPVFVGAAMAAVIGVGIAELLPYTNGKREALREEPAAAVLSTRRANFAYAAEGGRVYKVAQLDVQAGRMRGVEIERKGMGPEYPTYILAAASGNWERGRGWVLQDGSLHIVADSSADITFAFDSVRAPAMVERPIDLTATPRAPQDMGWRELGRFIRAMERSGADVNELKVERMLKLAIPATCIIIALFGAPLATSTQRGGAAYGIGISLGTTVIFLMLIQLTKAIGGKGLIPADLAAWIPNMAFGIVGLILLARVRT